MSLVPHNAATLRWRHNGRDGVSNHQPHDCLVNRLFRRGSKKISKLGVTCLCAGNSPGPVNSPHKWPVTQEMFPFDDVIMIWNDAGVFFITDIIVTVKKQITLSTGTGSCLKLPRSISRLLMHWHERVFSLHEPVPLQLVSIKFKYTCIFCT